MAKNKKGHWETTYVFDPVSGMDKPESVWVEDEPIPGEGVSVGGPGTTPTTPTGTTTTTSNSSYEFYVSMVEGTPLTEEQWEAMDPALYPYISLEEYLSYGYPPEMGIIPTTPSPTTAPTGEGGLPPLVMPTISMPGPPTPPPLPAVPTAPPYEPSPEQAAWEAEYAEELAKWKEAGGYGIPEETQTQMLQRATDILKARETENIRIMKNNMERRGITNSGFVFANEQIIRSSTTMAIANNIRDVQISSALTKMASFEKMMGSTAQFIGYLAQESAKAYVPKIAQWEMEAKYGLAGYAVAAQYGLAGYEAQVKGAIAQFQANAMAVMTEWQARFDLIKMEINQAYAQDNINLTNEWLQTLQDDQQEHEVEIAEIEAEAANQAAAAEGFWGMIGTSAGFILG